MKPLPGPAELKAEQERTLASPRRAYGLLARGLFGGMNLVYGRTRTLSKFKVLEVVARVPYQAWEQVAYVAMTHTYSAPGFARRIFEFVKESRAQQDNEQWHLLILEELVQNKGLREGFLLYRVAPQLVAFLYYHISWILYVIRPALSYELNADFEDHAEHEYMQFVSENPALESEPFSSEFAGDYGVFASLGDLFRNIGLDERHHKEESLARIAAARFGN
jgi:ubiquinol oxidase